MRRHRSRLVPLLLLGASSACVQDGGRPAEHGPETNDVDAQPQLAPDMRRPGEVPGPDASVTWSSDAAAGADASPSRNEDVGRSPSDGGARLDTGQVNDRPFAAQIAQLIKDGYTKADTPCWRPREGILVFKDSPASGGVFYKLTPPTNVSVFRSDGGRCTTALTPDQALYFRSAAGLSRLIDDKVELLAETFPDGTMMSVNDLVVSRQGIVYFSSLKWPDGDTGKGRMSLMRAASKAIEVMWDAKNVPELENPNGVAISPQEDVLYVGIARYANRGSSGIFRFPIRPDGTLDVAVGRAKVWGKVNAPDGIATDAAGNVYTISGTTIHALRPDGSVFATAKIPAGPGTNLGFGGADLTTLYITTNKALYQLPMNVTGTLP